MEMVTATVYVVPSSVARSTAVPAFSAVTFAVVFVSFLTYNTLLFDDVKFTICVGSSALFGRIYASASKESPTFMLRFAVFIVMPDALLVTVTKILFLTPSAITVISVAPVLLAITRFLLGSGLCTPVSSEVSM